jgi:Rieske Fe-S protein
MKDSKDFAETEISRRALLCGFGAIAATAAGFSLDSASAASGVTKLSGGKVSVDLAANKALAKVGGAVLFTAKDGFPAALVRTAAGAKGLTAISLVCTHMGVTVAQSQGKWICPAHGSLYALNGAVLGGPASSPLKKYPVTVTATKVVIG